ncbi:DUF3892 domain-containing protein [Leifsonia virtsii]|uniref:DUF3892 domain-containing protein n=1 Tax=Leifsonia virtsii TaxID=3035915 RepID=A0ABT8IYS9_9MICO|nr:DUF3892 domain-containing protein [Leifsonia virtsii]MDN4597972.1 DUF3892 domain-containing protein [Leifsonia virtsii]
MFEITGITVSSTPPSLGTITKYYFEGRAGEPSQWVVKADAVTYVGANPGSVYVSGGGATALVEVVEADPPYLRTVGDETPGDNLLALPVS